MSTTKRAEAASTAVAAARPPQPRTHLVGPPAVQEALAGSGAELVNRLVRTVCGAGAAASPGAAEGMALVGRRSASLLDVAVNEPADVLDAGRAPWVYHHIVDGSGSRVLVGAVELMADSHQTAVDLALAAHAIAERAGRPVTCRLDRALAGAVGVAQVPIEDGAAAVLGEAPGPERTERMARDELVEVCRATLTSIGARLGRSLDPLEASHLEAAEIGVVAIGSAVAPTRAAVARLRDAGLNVGMVALRQLRPLPTAALTELLSSTSGLALATWGGEDNEDSDLIELLGSIQADRTGSHSIPVYDLSALAPPVANLTEALAGLLGQAPPAAAAVAEPGLQCRLGVQPGGQWGRRMLLDVAAWLGGLTAVHLRLGLAADLARLDLRSDDVWEAGERAPADVIVVPHPALLEASALDGAVGDGALLVIETETDSDATFWGAFSPSALALVERRGLVVWRVDARGAGSQASQPARAARAVLTGATLGAMARSGRLNILGTNPLERLVSAAPAALDIAEDHVARWVAEGVRAVTQVTASPTERSAPPQALRELLLPAPPEETSEAWSRALRRFHLNGEQTRGAGDPSLGLPLTPIAVRSLIEAGEVSAAYPFFVPAEADNGAALTPQPLLTLLQTAAQSGAPMLADRLPLLSGAAAATLDDGALRTPRGALASSKAALLARFDLSEDGAKALAEEVDGLTEQLPDVGQLVGFGESAPLTLYLTSVRRARRPRLAAFVRQANRLLEAIEERLVVDRLNDPASVSAESVSTSMGVGGGLFDASALAKTLAPKGGSRRLSAAQRERLEAAQAVLAGLLAGDRAKGFVTIVHSEDLPGDRSAFDVRSIRHGNPLAAAIGIFDGLAAEWLGVFRALRVARLELENAYDPGVHDALLADFGWSSCTSDELALLPPVLAVERAERVHRSELAAFKQVLDSGRPVHALIIEHTPGQPGNWPGELGRTAVAHGEAFVLQSSVACPDQLVAGFERMGTLTRPGVAVVALPPPDSTAPAGILATAALYGRSTPCLRFDPDGGRDFADQIDLAGNPALQASWPADVVFAQEAATGQEQAIDTVVTWADAVALHDSRRSDFWVIPAEAWNEEQVELAALLLRDEAPGRRALPFIWVVGADGSLQRAIITRDLLLRTFDRQRAWHALQELGGVDNAFALRAAEAARAQAEATAEARRAELETALREEIEQARTEAAGEALDRVVSALLNLDTSAAAALVAPIGSTAPVVPPSAPDASPAVAAPAVEPAEEDDEEADFGFDQPYIDAFLCTTCNECTGINPVMFKYNADKQAYITDPTTGTFAELVESAEKCPARCIHPGKPRSDDATGTPEMVERAARFQ